MIGTKVLEERESKYNGHLKVLHTWGMGNYIQSNGLTQSGGIVETIWKSTIKKIDKRLEVKNICILGLGGGTLGKLLRKKYPNAKITGFEIDELMIELGKKYLKLDEYDIDIHLSDVKKTKFKTDNFDLLIIDMYNGDNFPKEFEEETFLQKIKSYITKNGLVIVNRLYYGEKRPDTVRFGRKLEKIFKKVDWFYPEANLMFLCSN